MGTRHSLKRFAYRDTACGDSVGVFDVSCCATANGTAS